MIDHLVIPVRDAAASKAFYRAALATLGYEILFEDASPDGKPTMVAFGVASKMEFVIAKTESTSAPSHVAFGVSERALVDLFYHAAMGAGGRDNGEPAVCPEYHIHYYAGFVLDPDGHNIEAVCHEPVAMPAP